MNSTRVRIKRVDGVGTLISSCGKAHRKANQQIRGTARTLIRLSQLFSERGMVKLPIRLTMK